MNVVWETLNITTTAREEMVDITSRVAALVGQKGLTEGACYVFVPHTTAGVTLNEDADPDVRKDMLATLSRLVPANGPYRHTEGNADAHVKASLVGNSQFIPVTGGRLMLGTWQGIFLCEFDGPRQRRILVGIS